ncbi:DUF3320 domain-containing protein [Deinococcus sp. SDU3-2]|uniref:DUF3320 domain-containing protein n=1 Tax=Deinococcus terrestris TaxID=2651870 RepID=A0A7X1NXP6_9DEIO|nr:DUF3320 domain-containing protein [Deinococcus terrestris]MPY67727.1 DUF3320 domain-containing protein [Deinococcus terrestris]
MTDTLSRQETVNLALARHRELLLDLSTRNPLLHFVTRDAKGKLKPKRLELQTPSLDELFRTLVTEGRAVVFEGARDILPEDDEDPAGFMRAGQPGLRKGDLKVQVPLNSLDLQKRLIQTARTSREFLEEQGLHCLYLGLGQLRWFEDRKTSDDPYSPRLAPLLLIPVTLERQARSDGFRLVYTGDELQGNLTLAMKLREQGLTLPELPASEDLLPSSYFTQVEEALRSRMTPVSAGADLEDWFAPETTTSRSVTWSVDTEMAFLGFFSFSKFLMYRDLLPGSWPEGLTPHEHPLIAPLLAGQVSDERLTVLDSLDEATTGPGAWHVLDADSSQAEAIYHVLQGQHLVLQGPPGTGKSQTITNMIAGLVAQGKTVLFVAEKEAALSVVEDRLRKVGLGHAVLALHSKDAKKTALRDALQQAMQQARRITVPDQGEDARLAELVSQLQDVPHALNTPAGSGRTTPFEAMGRLLALQAQLSNAQQLLQSGGPPFGTVTWTDQQWALARQLTQELAEWIAQRGLPQQLTLWGSPKAAELPQERARLATALELLETHGHALRTELAQGQSWQIPEAAGLPDVHLLITQLQTLLGAPDLGGLAVEAARWEDALATLKMMRGRQDAFLSLERELTQRLMQARAAHTPVPAAPGRVLETLSHVAQLSEQLLALKAELLRDLHPEALDAESADLAHTREVLDTAGRSPLAFLNGRVRQARRQAQGWLRASRPLDEVLGLLASAEQYQELRQAQVAAARQSPLPLGELEQVPWALVTQLVDWLCRVPQPDTRTVTLAWQALGRALSGPTEVTAPQLDELLAREAAAQPDEHLHTLLGPHLRGFDTPWEDLTAKAEWLAHWQAQTHPTWVTTLVVGMANTPTLRTPLQDHLASLERHSSAVREALGEVRQLIQYPSFGGDALDRLLEQTRALQADRQALSAVVSWNNLAPRLKQAGLDRLLDLGAALPQGEGGRQLPAAAELLWYAELIDHAFQDRPVLAGFDRQRQDLRRRQFRQLDLDRFALNRLRVQQAYLQRVPQASGVGQVGILQREFAKKKRLLPIRDLMQVAGKAIQAIKPVFMMSPLSLANFIPLGSLTFDVVIFDEASQVRPSDALGSLLRGRQAVVVGDLKQLGPTNFFGKASGQDEEDEDDTAGLESLLSLFEAQYAGYRRSLTWHYRSQHESLIQTSNEAFYEGELVTFPSARGQADDLGLRYHHLDPREASFDRGGKRINRGEAEAVVEAVVRHARERPQESLAVVTFSAAQQKLIADRIEGLVPTLEEKTQRFFSETAPERFVVKNLENVQGDERDVIMISVGYGFAPDGRTGGVKFYRAFGPLGTADGWRRLNVLITRARRRIEVFANFLPEDITGLNDTDSHRGLHAFKQFLERSRGQGQQAAASTVQAEVGLPQQVAGVLRGAGYEVHEQVGSSASRIELAVVHPEKPGEYVLGIELDGPRYQQARSVRDRDRLREDVLGVFGWQILRLWSVEWFRDPESAREDLLARVRQAIQDAARPEPDAEPPRAEDAPSTDEDPWAWPAPDSNSLSLGGQTEESLWPDTVSESLVLQGAPYREAAATLHSSGEEFHKLDRQQLQLALVEIVRQEGPIHQEVLARRLMKAANITRKGVRVQDTIDSVLSFAVQTGQVERQGAFVCLPGLLEVLPRSRADRPANEQSLDYVSDLELLWTIHRVVGSAVGITRQELPSGCLELLGLKKVMADHRVRIDGLIEFALQSGVLTQQQGTLVLSGKQ